MFENASVSGRLEVENMKDAINTTMVYKKTIHGRCRAIKTDNRGLFTYPIQLNDFCELFAGGFASYFGSSEGV